MTCTAKESAMLYNAKKRSAGLVNGGVTDYSTFQKKKKSSIVVKNGQTNNFDDYGQQFSQQPSFTEEKCLDDTNDEPSKPINISNQ